MKKKKTEEAKQFWELAEKTSKQVESWPPWKQQFASGTATKSAAATPPMDAAKTESHSD
jgi:hypothetical protein